MNFQKTDSEETEDENMNPSSRWGVLSKRTTREAFVESTYNQVSVESDDTGSSAIVTLPDECECCYNIDFVLQKVNNVFSLYAIVNGFSLLYSMHIVV